MNLRLLTGLLAARSEQLRAALASRRLGRDTGATTLELVIIALGLIGVATLLVVALTNAVKSRTDQIQ